MGFSKNFLWGAANAAAADYVWLLLRFDGDRVLIDWKGEWRLEDYEDA